MVALQKKVLGALHQYSDIILLSHNIYIIYKFALPYACIFMDKLEANFLAREPVKPWIWYIDNVFLSGQGQSLRPCSHFADRYHSGMIFVADRPCVHTIPLLSDTNFGVISLRVQK